MKKKLQLLLVIIIVNSNCFSQETSQKQAGLNDELYFSNVHCLLLINYSHGLSSGEYIYPEYGIKKGDSEFLIEARDRYKQPCLWSVPFTKSEMNKPGKMDISPAMQLPDYTQSIKADHYISEKQTYKINDTAYSIYRHINYNCYDRFCGLRHNHITFSTGETYFSPDYGILVHVDNQNMQFNLMASIKEKKVPVDLIVEILRSRKTGEKIIQQYLSKTREINATGKQGQKAQKTKN